MEKPILFSGPMVRAILEGRKTQTRRIVKPVPQMVDNKKTATWEGNAVTLMRLFDQVGRSCPYGHSGDRLWVRETWQGPLMDCDTMENEYRGSPDDFHKPEYCVYAADGGPTPEFITQDDELVCRWRPSIHMPRWACRILLEITGIRVERLHDISANDCVAEGCGAEVFWPESNSIAQYKRLWESINGADSWASNPWVWVIEFRRVSHG